LLNLYYLLFWSHIGRHGLQGSSSVISLLHVSYWKWKYVMQRRILVLGFF
jgi:hypothetical protein